MYEVERELAKKRKKRKASAILGGVSVLGITALSIVAFLGRYTGTFTVTLNTGNVKLTMSKSSDFEEETSFIMVEQLPIFEEYTYSSIKKVENLLDSEDTDYLVGKNESADGVIKTINFFKYTFFIKNVGNVPAGYKLTVNLLENTESLDNRKLDDTLRVAIYENPLDSTTHDSTIYAKRSAVVNEDEEGNATFKEYVSTPLYKANASNPFMGFAEEFETNDRIATLYVSDFHKGDVNRYTLITWLEGEDLQSDERLGTPQGAKIKLGVEINAYEN